MGRNTSGPITNIGVHPEHEEESPVQSGEYIAGRPVNGPDPGRRHTISDPDPTPVYSTGLLLYVPDPDLPEKKLTIFIISNKNEKKTYIYKLISY